MLFPRIFFQEARRICQFPFRCFLGCGLYWQRDERLIAALLILRVTGACFGAGALLLRNARRRSLSRFARLGSLGLRGLSKLTRLSSFGLIASDRLAEYR